MTGAGEQICKTLLAKTCSDTLLFEDDVTVATNNVLNRFINSPLLRTYDEKQAGFIAVKVESLATSIVGADAGVALDEEEDKILSESRLLPTWRAEFVFAHTTKTMGIAYMSARDTKPTAIMSQRKPDCTKVVFTRMVKA
ncbi:taspase, threonine aspartase, 1 [Mortierella claussenii]|nr:taspase, threonine aspartase, 1 [Mortierella claussenii]